MTSLSQNIASVSEHKGEIAQNVRMANFSVGAFVGVMGGLVAVTQMTGLHINNVPDGAGLLAVGAGIVAGVVSSGVIAKTADYVTALVKTGIEKLRGGKIEADDAGRSAHLAITTTTAAFAGMTVAPILGYGTGLAAMAVGTVATAGFALLGGAAILAVKNYFSDEVKESIGDKLAKRREEAAALEVKETKRLSI